MLIIDVFRLSTRMFRTNRSRTILTILGISVGIGAILFLVSLGYGLQTADFKPDYYFRRFIIPGRQYRRFVKP